jgi:serine/threonine protein kinase
VDWYLLGVLLYEMLVGCPPYFSPNKQELFNNIQRGVLRIPASLSTEAKNLIVALLHRNPSKRLGGGVSGAADIKQHPFFETVDWQIVKDRKLPCPKPNVNWDYLNQLASSAEDNPTHQKVFEDLEEHIVEEDRNVDGWTFVNNAE